MLPAWGNESDVAPGEADGTIYGGARMVACYFENVTWMYDPVPVGVSRVLSGDQWLTGCLQRPILDNDYLPTVYARSTYPPSAHKLACVYFIMSLGVMVSMALPLPAWLRGHLTDLMPCSLTWNIAT